VEIRWPAKRRIAQVDIYPGDSMPPRHLATECVPLDYRLQNWQAGQWVDLVASVTNAMPVW